MISQFPYFPSIVKHTDTSQRWEAHSSLQQEWGLLVLSAKVAGGNQNGSHLLFGLPPSGRILSPTTTTLRRQLDYVYGP